ncbi:MAG: winged helix-turn-helix domain-containing protein [Phenylobacterium sp.]|uniref:winged helix-turn-helix domain-containing protein n=1 Tax=Phenylobacterium sp. TaxID=1871053 RepID=UPI002735BB96|nr:winged helix-turn-helix domain-containing protein [Phenylobacterium sp.]MDP3749049.1 winged helix-turn-helix domain-containing protein [Phenylobacterium sp.]
MADDGSQLTGEAKSFAPHRRLDLANEHDFQLGAFRVRPAYREVRRGDVIDILEPRVMQVLAALARRMGAVVSRDELLRDCWGDVSVTDDSLHRCIGRLRKLSESDDRRSFVIETVPRVGYRLVAADLVDRREAETPQSPEPTPEVQARRLGHLPALALGGLVLALVAAGGWWLVNRGETWTVKGFESAADTLLYEAQPALSASGGQLAYAAGPDGKDQDIFVRNIRDGSTALLVGGPSDDASPAWSPTGDRVAFARVAPDRPCQIMIKTLPAGPERRLATCRSSETTRIAWSPDGARLYFADRPELGAARQIRSVAAEGGATTIVTAPPAWMRGDLEPMISPDGRSLAFVRWAAIGVSDIYVQDLSGGEPRRITNDGTEVAGLAWSTTGKSLFFSSNRSGDFGIWSVPASGRDQPVRLGPGLREVRRLSSGADGALAMELADVRANLVEIQAGRLGGTVITNEAGVQWAGDISPTGVLAYIADTRAGRSVWTRAPGQPAQKQTFFQATHMDDLRWSPDGQRLAFVAASHGRYGVYEIAAAGGPPRILLSGDYEMTSLSWEANSQTLVLAANRGGARRLWRLDIRKPGQITPITGPGWAAVRVSSAGLLGMKANTSGIWSLSADGSRARRLTGGPDTPTNAWIVQGERQFWIDWSGRQPEIMGAGVEGGTVSLVAEAPAAATYSGLAIDPNSGAMVYTRKIQMDIDIGLMRLERTG